MAQVPAIDVSHWQGTINFAGVPQEIVVIKMSGGDNGLYYDAQGGANYYAAKAAGKAVAGYHFAGGTDPIAEAQQFLRAMSPLDADDVMVLDWEVQNADPVGWCKQFVEFIHTQTGIWCLVYLNISTTNAHDWSPVLNNCGLYIAAPSYGWSDTIPVKYPVVMQQGPYITDPGISGNIDSDMWFGTVDQFKAYGYHAPGTPPTPDPKPPASSPSASVSSSTSTSASSSTSPSTSSSASESVSASASASPSASPEEPETGNTLLDWVKNIIQVVVNFLTSWRKK